MVLEKGRKTDRNAGKFDNPMIFEFSSLDFTFFLKVLPKMVIGIV